MPMEWKDPMLLGIKVKVILAIHKGVGCMVIICSRAASKQSSNEKNCGVLFILLQQPRGGESWGGGVAVIPYLAAGLFICDRLDDSN